MKTQIADLDRGIYDVINEERHAYVADKGLTPEIVREISKEKNEPRWMTDFRLRSLEIYNSKPVPTWRADLPDLDVDNIIHYVKLDTNLSTSWDDVPEDIKETFDRLGIPEAEKASLAGVGAHYDSEVVYHSMRVDLEEQGVVYMDMETALHEHEDIVKKYFMTLIRPNDQKFAAHNKRVPQGQVYTERGHNPNCGDDITLHLKVEEGVIVDGGYTGHGCAISQASTSIMIDNLRGKTVAEAQYHLGQFFRLVKQGATDEEKKALGDALVLENLADMPTRVKCGVLGWHCARVIQETIEN